MLGEVGELKTAFRRAMSRFATGVTIVTTRHTDGRYYGLAANAFSSVSLEPPLVLVCVGRDSTSLPALQASQVFAVNILGDDQRHISDLFATKSPDKFSATSWLIGANGCPILPQALAAVECRVVKALDAGDHVVFFGSVHDVQLPDRPADPLLFYSSQYWQLPLDDDDSRKAS